MTLDDLIGEVVRDRLRRLIDVLASMTAPAPSIWRPLTAEDLLSADVWLLPCSRVADRQLVRLVRVGRLDLVDVELN